MAGVGDRVCVCAIAMPRAAWRAAWAGRRRVEVFLEGAGAAARGGAGEANATRIISGHSKTELFAVRYMHTLICSRYTTRFAALR